MKDIVLCLVRNGYVRAEGNNMGGSVQSPVVLDAVGTILSNMAYYGFMPSNVVLKNLVTMSLSELTKFWATFEPALKEVTADDRDIADFVVYKNFPTEVLEMSRAQYWYNQILMYLGFPNELFTQEAVSRPAMEQLTTLKVLHQSNADTLNEILISLTNCTSRWTENQFADAKAICQSIGSMVFTVNDFNFKENAINLMVALGDGIKYEIEDATDVLRFVAVLAGNNVSLNPAPKFKKFSRSERRHILSMLENTKNLNEDIAMRPEIWKRLLYNLHPGDYKSRFPNVIKAYDLLYRDRYMSFNKIADGSNSKIVDIINSLKGRPGEFLRRFHSLYNMYGSSVVEDFCSVLPKLTTHQLLSFERYLTTINNRRSLFVAPRGNWRRAQILKNAKCKISKPDIRTVCTSITNVIRSRAYMNTVAIVDSRLGNVKLPTNGQEHSEYSRGTVVNIPNNINFLRSASYWEYATDDTNVWYDNSWNFFDNKWKSKGAECWDTHSFSEKGAVFSGDPTNSKDMEGRAAQLIDLDIQQLVDNGVRYAVWSVLCYNRKPFSDAEEVLGTLQFLDSSVTGALYEPSRAEIVFPIKGDEYVKYLAYVDLVDRKVVYMDVSLYANVQSASVNGDALETQMPAYIEYLNSIPSVLDLFRKYDSILTNAVVLHESIVDIDSYDTFVLYDDENVTLTSDKSAYVHKTINADSQFIRIDINEILKQK